MRIHSITTKQLKAMLEYAEKYGTVAFNLDNEMLPSELCRYRNDGECRMSGEECPILSYGCKMMCLKCK